MAWLSVHVFYFSDLDRMLADCIAPLVADLRERQVVDRFFFVRYMEGGPHLRLRVRGEADVLAETARPVLDRALGAYLERVPSREILTPDQLKRLGIDWTEHPARAPFPPQPNNSVLYVPYEPEVERYGGPAGLAISEDAFDFSSRMALELLAGGGGGDVARRRRLGTALRVMFVFSTAMGFTVDQTRRMFELYHRQVLSFAPMPFETLAAHFAAQRTPLTRTLRELLDDVGPDASYLGRWASHGREIGRRLRAVDLTPSRDRRIPRIARIAMSHMHMFNNRLGIFYPDELYLTYLLYRTCEELAGDASPRTHEGAPRSASGGTA